MALDQVYHQETELFGQVRVLGIGKVFGRRTVAVVNRDNKRRVTDNRCRNVGIYPNIVRISTKVKDLLQRGLCSIVPVPVLVDIGSKPQRCRRFYRTKGLPNRHNLQA